jgi:hypothetical protein
MARRKDDRDRPAARGAHDGSAPTDAPAEAPIAAGPRAFIVEEERLSDGRYILYYGWSAPERTESTLVPARKPRAPRTTVR